MVGITAIPNEPDLLFREGLRPPENYHDVFIVLGERAILPSEMVDCMTAMVEFRNLLVYEHSTVDDMLVYGFAKKRLNDFTDFSNAVRGQLSYSISADSPSRNSPIQ